MWVGKHNLQFAMWQLLFCSRIMQAFIMTDDRRQMQHDSCMLIILCNIGHRPFTGFLSQPSAAKRKTPVEWTLDQAWYCSVVICYIIRTEVFILIWTKPPYGNGAIILMMTVSWECCGGPRHCRPSYSLPAHIEQHMPLLPHVRAQCQRCWGNIARVTLW